MRLRGSWSYTRADLSQDSPGLLDDGADAFEGDRLPGAPRHQGSLLASCATLLGRDVAFEVQYGYSYVGDMLTRIGLRAGGEALPAYDVHNVSASISKDDWTLTFYADNLLDEYAVTGVRQTPGLIGLTEDGFRAAATSPTCSPRGGSASASDTPSGEVRKRRGHGRQQPFYPRRRRYEEINICPGIERYLRKEAVVR